MFEKIKALCKEKGVTIYRLEKELGFSSGSISKWDTTSPGVDKVAAVANYFHVTIESLLERKVE